MREVIENRSVAIVGRAEYLNEIEQAELIDSHDVVIRAHSNLPYPSQKFKLAFDNDESFVPKDFHDKLGKKTTAFAPANVAYWSPDDADSIVPQLASRGCQCIIQHKIYNLVGPSELAILDYIADRYMPVFTAPHDQLLDLMRALDYTLPMPGTILIDFIAKLNPATVYCTGFACYQDSDEIWLKNEVKLFRDHKPLYDLRFLRDLARANDKVTVDAEMQKYFANI